MSPAVTGASEPACPWSKERKVRQIRRLTTPLEEQSDSPRLSAAPGRPARPCSAPAASEPVPKPPRDFIFINHTVPDRPTASAMTGGVMYQHSQHAPIHSTHVQELMTDWTSSISSMGNRAEKERPAPSPTFSLLSAPESASHQSPYNMPQPIVMHANSPHYGGYPGSQPHLMPYTPTRSSNNGDPMWQGHNAGYYQPFPTPDGKDPYPIRSFDGKGEGHLLTSTALRHDALPMARTASAEPAQKRKRASSGAKDSAGNPSKALKTPKRPKQSSPDDHTAKRARTDNNGVINTAPSQLPTPPTLGKEISTYSLPHHVPPPPQELSPPASGDEAESANRRPGVVIARHEQEGRKINIFGVQHGENEEVQPDQAHLVPRKVGVLTLKTDDTTGRANVEPSMVLEHEAAWLQGKRSANDIQLVQPRTPGVNDHAALPPAAEINETPRTKEGKVSKRLEAFAADVKPNESMVSTRIVKVGRVALRKDAAIKFLGLDDTVGTCEETKSEEDEHWIESAVASSSKAVLTPNWPDDESPWRLAGGLARHRKLREADEKAAILRRYLESATDESSDEERENVQPHIREDDKRTVSNYISRAQAAATRRRGHRVALHADAKAALLGSLRSGLVTYFSPGGPVNCQCGVASRADKGKMISCDGCRDWHHLECQGITDEYSLQGHWLCHACVRQANPLERNIRPIAMLDPYQERAAAFKDWSSNVALAPSPLFPAVPSLATRTPGRKEFLGSSPRRPQRSRIMSYGSDYFNFPEDSPANPMPSTPAPIRPNRFSTPRNEDMAFDVHSTPSRHIDFNLGGPSLFSLTPLAARGRVTSGLGGNLLETPMRKSLAHGLAASEPSEFFKELNKGAGIDGVGSMTVGASPQTRWPHSLMGAHNLSPSPFSHRRSLSGNNGRMSSIRSSSRSGLGVGFADPPDDDE